MIEKDEINLVDSCCAGREEAFRELFRTYQNDVFNLTYRMTGSREEAEDLTQETFIRVIRRINSFQQRSSLSTWIYRIAVNVTVDSQRKKRKRKELSFEKMDKKGPILLPLHKRAVETPEDLLLKKELREVFQAVLNLLPSGYRLIFILGPILRIPYKEITQIVNLSESGVRMKIHRARKMVRDLIKPYLEEGKLPEEIRGKTLC